MVSFSTDVVTSARPCHLGMVEQPFCAALESTGRCGHMKSLEMQKLIPNSFRFRYFLFDFALDFYLIRFLCFSLFAEFLVARGFGVYVKPIRAIHLYA